MKRASLQELGFARRDDALVFLKRLWRRESTQCPLCKDELELLHKGSKADDCDWRCRRCDTVYRTMHLLRELPD